MEDLLNQGHQRHLPFDLLLRWGQEIVHAHLVLQGHHCHTAIHVHHAPSLPFQQLRAAGRELKRDLLKKTDVSQGRCVSHSIFVKGYYSKANCFRVILNDFRLDPSNVGQIGPTFQNSAPLNFHNVTPSAHSCIYTNGIWSEMGAEVVLRDPSHVVRNVEEAVPMITDFKKPHE